jgi:GrpB-like predicted nucleotidyltransferase (UPF0157 family)
MLTPEQEKWINHLSNTDEIKIVPFDPTSQEKFEKVKSIIQSKMGKDIRVEHRGATSLGISGQDEIDIYIPISQANFDNHLTPLIELFGEPRSHYSLERARFVTFEEGKHIDIFLINKEGSGWLDGVRFENYLKGHPEDLEKYRLLKEEGAGLSCREYYRRKIEFINEILSKANL